jgi:hypothetical protein
MKVTKILMNCLAIGLSFLVAWVLIGRCMRLFFVTTPSGMREQYFGSDVICLVVAMLVGIATYFLVLRLLVDRLSKGQTDS